MTLNSDKINTLPCVDVILPFHRCDSLLKAAIESVLKSINVEIFLILIDDRPSSVSDFACGLELILKNTKYKIIRNEIHGYGRSLNLGLQECSSDFVALMNSDDLVSPHRFHRQITRLESTDSHAVVCKIQKIYKNFSIPSLSGAPNLRFYDPALLLLGAYGADATLLGKRSFIQTLRFFENSGTCDWITALIEYPNIKVIGLNEQLYFYRIHAKQITQNTHYVRNSFADIYPHWKNYNEALGLPTLNFDTAMAISFPSGVSKEQLVNSLQLKKWTICYLKLFSGKGRREAEKLIFRRLVSLSVTRKKWNWHFFTILKMSIEYLRLKTLGVHPK